MLCCPAPKGDPPVATSRPSSSSPASPAVPGTATRWRRTLRLSPASGWAPGLSTASIARLEERSLIAPEPGGERRPPPAVSHHGRRTGRVGGRGARDAHARRRRRQPPRDHRAGVCPRDAGMTDRESYEHLLRWYPLGVAGALRRRDDRPPRGHPRHRERGAAWASAREPRPVGPGGTGTVGRHRRLVTGDADVRLRGGWLASSCPGGPSTTWRAPSSSRPPTTGPPRARLRAIGSPPGGTTCSATPPRSAAWSSLLAGASWWCRPSCASSRSGRVAPKVMLTRSSSRSFASPHRRSCSSSWSPGPTA